MFLSANVRRLAVGVRVVGRKDVIEVEFRADGCHKRWVGAEDLVKVSCNADVTASFLAFREILAEIVDALLTGVGVGVAGGS